MRLARIERVVWDVLAIMDGRGRTTWDELKEDPSRYASRMRALIRQSARDGPPRNPYQCAPLGDGIFEFKRGPKKGPKLRVFFFYDEGRQIICSHSVWKREAVPEEKRKAADFKRGYQLAKSRGRLSILDSGAQGG